MSTQSFTFPVLGKDYTLHAVGGTVLDTDQRSDTRISGAGSTTIINGTGGGNMRVSSSITVQRDIWLRLENGQEEHVRFAGDMPVRKGQVLYLLNLEGATLGKGQRFNGLYAIYNASVNK